MRVLFLIPHFFRATRAEATNRSERPQARQERAVALMATLAALRQTFGSSTYGLDHGERTARQATPAHEYLAVDAAGRPDGIIATADFARTLRTARA